jgi:DEAD/DEAH box helicase domain-containing protein
MPKIGNGYQAGSWWKNGEYEKVRDYCLKDVEITKSIFEYALQHGMLKYRDFGEIKEIKIDTSTWLSPVEKAPMTHTLPF